MSSDNAGNGTPTSSNLTRQIVMEQEGIYLASKLKLLRELAGLSQRELAKRAGVTNSSISMIEQGLVSPSVQSLARILSAFPVSLADFFTFQLPATNCCSSATNAPLELHQADVTQLQSRIEYLPPQSSSAFLLAATDMAAVVMQGQLTLTLLSGLKRFTQGESFYLHKTQLFRFTNTGTIDVQLFCCSPFVR